MLLLTFVLSNYIVFELEIFFGIAIDNIMAMMLLFSCMIIFGPAYISLADCNKE